MDQNQNQNPNAAQNQQQEHPIPSDSNEPVPNGYTLVEFEGKQQWVPKSWVDADGNVKRPDAPRV